MLKVYFKIHCYFIYSRVQVDAEIEKHKKITATEEKKLKSDEYKKNRNARKCQYRKRKVIESLKVSPDDKRRDFFKLFFSYLHSHNFEQMRVFFCENAVDQFLYKYGAEGLDNIILPQKIEIRGIDNFMKYVPQVVKSFPDIVYTLDDIIIRNRKFGSCLTANCTYKYTPLYEVLMKAPISEIMEVIGLINFNEENTITEGNDEKIVNITELSRRMEKLDLSNQKNSDVSNNIEFETGKIIKQKIKTYNGRGCFTFHMNRDQKIYLFEHFAKRDETDSVKEFKINIKRDIV